MNYSYKNKMGWEEVVCYITIILVTAIAIIANTISPINQPNQYNTEVYELFSSSWWQSMIGIFIMDIFIAYMIYLIGAKRRNYIKWRKKITDNGNRFDGTVKEIKFIKSNMYRLKVSYFSDIYQRENVFVIPEIYIKNLDTNKKIVCDVYELADIEEKHDYDSDIFTIKDNSISMSANPIKIFKTLHRKYTDKNFGNAHAENFRYKDNNE